MPPRRWPNRRVLLGLGAAATGVSVLLIFRAYRSESYRKFREAVRRLQQAGDSYSAALLAGADVSASVLTDLRQFLQSDRDVVPASLRQLAKLAQSEDVTQAAAALTSAVLRGAHNQHAPSSSAASPAPAPDLLERLLTALTSERGQSLVGLAISVACRTSVQTLVDSWGSAATESATPGGGVHLHVESLAGRYGSGPADERESAGGWLQVLLRWAATPQGERVVLNAVSTFVRQGTEVYMSSFADANMFDDILSAAGKAQHWPIAQQLTRTFVNEAVATWCGHRGSRQLATPAALAIPAALRTGTTGSSSRQQQQQFPHSPLAGRCTSPGASQCSLSDRSEAHSDASPTALAAVADLDSAFEEGVSVCKPAAGLQDPAEAAKPSTDAAEPGVAVGDPGTSSWSSTVLLVIQKPEARSLILAMTPVVVAEGVRTGLICTRDLMLGGSSQSITSQAKGALRLPAWIMGLVALLVMVWMGARVQTVPTVELP